MPSHTKVLGVQGRSFMRSNIFFVRAEAFAAEAFATFFASAVQVVVVREASAAVQVAVVREAFAASAVQAVAAERRWDGAEALAASAAQAGGVLHPVFGPLFFEALYGRL